MRLKKLTISSVHGKIREIIFRDGLNLIIDNQENETENSSGNGVGKTTCLRMIDFCLGSEGSDVYTEEEFEIVNHELFNFLENNSVFAELLIEKNTEIITLKRGFGEPLILSIDGKDYDSLDNYKYDLNKIIFNIDSKKPSFRELIKKFVRKDKYLMSKTLNYLESGTDNKYELVYLTLLNLFNENTLIDRFGIKEEITKTINRIRALKNGQSLPTIKQLLEVTNEEIRKAIKEKDNYNTSVAYDDKLNKLSDVKINLSKISGKITSLETQISMHENTIYELKENISKIDTNSLISLYDDFSSSFKEISKRFEDLQIFHNQLIENKIKFVQESLYSKQILLKELSKKHKDYSRTEQSLLIDLFKDGALDGIDLLHERIVFLSEKKGRQEQLIEEIKDAESLKNELQDKLREMEDDFTELKINLETYLKNFNKFLTDFSKKLYGDSIIFTYDDKKKDKIKFTIESSNLEMSGGKKKAYVTAIDFSFSKFYQEEKIDMPEFILHDSIEDIANNQLKTLFSISEDNKIQYVVTIIRDRLESKGLESAYIDKLFKEYKILDLSEKNKFFKF